MSDSKDETNNLPPHSDGEVSPRRGDGGVKSPSPAAPDPSVRDDAAASPDDGGGKSPADSTDPYDRRDMAEIWKVVAGEARQRGGRAAETAERMWRHRRRAVRLTLPPITDTASIARAHAEVIAQAADDRITPEHALIFSTMLEYRRRSIEMLDMEIILHKLNDEARKRGGKR